MKHSQNAQVRAMLKENQISEMKLVYSLKSPLNKVITNSDSVAELLRDASYDKDTIELKESFHVIYLNRSHKILGTLKISEGGTNY